jgi:hypothetical protein
MSICHKLLVSTLFFIPAAAIFYVKFSCMDFNWYLGEGMIYLFVGCLLVLSGLVYLVHKPSGYGADEQRTGYGRINDPDNGSWHPRDAKERAYQTSLTMPIYGSQYMGLGPTSDHIPSISKREKE